MFCLYCGAADQLGGKFCKNCGQFLPDLLEWTEKFRDLRREFGLIAVWNALSICCIAGSSLLYSAIRYFSPDAIIVLCIGLLGCVGALLNTAIRAGSLYRQLKQPGNQSMITAEPGAADPGSLQPPNPSELVQVPDAEEETTALLEKGKATQRH